MNILTRVLIASFIIVFITSCGGASPAGDSNTGNTDSGFKFGFEYGGTADPNVVIWKFSEAGDDITSPAIASDGTIYVGSKDKYLYAINSDGSLKWKFRTETGTGISSPPALGNDSTIYFVDYAETIYAINPNGTKLWSIANIGGGGVSVADNGAILVGGYALSPTDGSNYWYLGFDINKKPVLEAVRSDTVYLVQNDKLLAHELLLSTERWKFTADNTIRTTPAIGNDGTLYFGDRNGIFYAINDDGTEKWRFVVGPNEAALNSPVIGADGTIYISFGSSFDSKLYAFTKEGSLRWDYDVSFPHESPVIGSDGTIYIATNELAALKPDGTVKWEAITYRSSQAAPTIDVDGYLYTPFSRVLYKLDVNTGGIANSAWPVKYGDLRNTSSN